MTLTLEVPEELEKQLRNAAIVRGVSLDSVSLDALQKSVGKGNNGSSKNESELLEVITHEYSSDWWNEYNALVKNRQDETISENELNQLIRLTEELEAFGAKRLESLVELAIIRQTSVDQLIAELGVTLQPESL